MPIDSSRRPGRTALRAAIVALFALAGILMLTVPANAGSPAERNANLTFAPFGQ